MSLRPRFLITIAAALACATRAIAAQGAGAYLGDLTWPDAQRRLSEVPVVIVPFGAGAKEHGPHLPMNADAKVMEYLVAQAVANKPVLAAPPTLHGWFPAFRELPGTEIADADVFWKYMYEVAASLVEHGAKRIIFLNTGVSKATGLPLSIAARELRQRTGAPTLVVSWDDLETPELRALAKQKAGGHADEIETSIALFLQPRLVHMDRAVADYGSDSVGPIPGYRPGTFSRTPGDPDYTKTGVFGDPTLASAEKGKRALQILTTQWLMAIDRFSRVPTRAGR